MATATTTTYAAAIKQLWPENRLFKATYLDNPTWAMIPKRFNFRGSPARVALRYADVAGRSATFSNAQSQASPTANAGWLITSVKDYAVATIDGDLIDTAMTDDGAVMDALEAEMDSAVNRMTRSVGLGVHGTSVGVFVQNSSGTSSPITVADPTALAFLEVGDTFGAVSDATGGGTVRTGSGVVTNIDRVGGVVTYTGTITGLLATDYLFIVGDYNARYSGFRDWVPDTAPGATAFFGVTRNVDTRLGGTRFDATSGGGATIEEALQKSQALALQLAGKPKSVYMNPVDVGSLMITMGTRAVLTETKVGGIGFEGIKVFGPGGSMTVYQDFNVALGRAELWDFESCFGLFRGKPCRIIENDGNQILRAASTDSYEVRLVTRGNFVFTRPSSNCNTKLY